MRSRTKAFVFVCVMVILTEIFTPWTTTEESFNMHAMHDFLYTTDTRYFHHHQFPGEVPHTFLGPWLVSLITLWPTAFIAEAVVRWMHPKLNISLVEVWMRSHPVLFSHACRLVLAAAVLAPLWDSAVELDRSAEDVLALSESDDKENLASAAAVSDDIRRKKTIENNSRQRLRTRGSNAQRSGCIFLLLFVTQKGMIRNASRPLSATFATVFCNVALSNTLSGQHGLALAMLTAGAVLFRYDLLVFLAAYAVAVIARRGLRIRRVVAICILTGAFVGSLTALGLDSLLWDRWLWPEASGLIDAVVEQYRLNTHNRVQLQQWAEAFPRVMMKLSPWVALVGSLTALDRLTAPQISSTSFLRSVWRHYQPVLLPPFLCLVVFPKPGQLFMEVLFPWVLAPVAVLLTAALHQAAPGHRTRRAFVVFFCGLSLAGLSVSVGLVYFPGSVALKLTHAEMRADLADPRSCLRQRVQRGSTTQPTVYIDAEAAASGINAFQERYLSGHVPLLEPIAGDPSRWVTGDTMGVELRWWRMLLLPFDAIGWRTWLCLPDFGQTLLRKLQETPWETVRGVAAHLAARHRARFALESIDGSRGSCYVRLTPRRLSATTLPSHVRYVHCARFSESEPSHTPQQPQPPHGSSPIGAAVCAGGYNASGIDYAIVPASQRDLHLLAHHDFEILHVVKDQNPHRLVLWSIADSLVKHTVSFLTLGKVELDSLPQLEDGRDHLLVLRRKACTMADERSGD